jgi:hypothetical protein
MAKLPLLGLALLSLIGLTTFGALAMGYSPGILNYIFYNIWRVMDFI